MQRSSNGDAVSRHTRRTILAHGLASLACFVDMSCAPQAPAATAPRSGGSKDPEPHPAALFDFHSSPWVNLHHVLDRQGVKLKGGADPSETDGLDAIDHADLGVEERRAWDASVASYASLVSARDLTFDDELGDINNRLSALESSAALGNAKLPSEIARALESAMPVYRQKWWPEHDRRNRAWIASLSPLVDVEGRAVARELAKIYQTEWPKDPLRVDVSVYTCWEGAYTTLGPSHLTITGIDPRNQVPAGFEIVFHEASHAIIRPVRDALDRELAARRESHRNLWHALLFFSTGYVVKRHVSGYVPYAYANHLWERVWPTYLPAFEAHWIPYLDGKQSFEAALHDVVSALA